MFGHFSAKNIRFKTREMNKTREFQTSKFQTTEYLCSDTFPPKIFASKTNEMNEFQTSRFQTTESLCSVTFRSKIFASKIKLWAYSVSINWNSLKTWKNDRFPQKVANPATFENVQINVQNAVYAGGFKTRFFHDLWLTSHKFFPTSNKNCDCNFFSIDRRPFGHFKIWTFIYPKTDIATLGDFL